MYKKIQIKWLGKKKGKLNMKMGKTADELWEWRIRAGREDSPSFLKLRLGPRLVGDRWPRTASPPSPPAAAPPA